MFIKKKEEDFPVGPVLLGVFLFVVVGSGKRPLCDDDYLSLLVIF